MLDKIIGKVYKLIFKFSIMDSFIKKIFDGNGDSFVHLQFQKFSKGIFKSKAIVKASKSKDKYSISTTYEYSNEFVRSVAEEIPNNQKVNVKGIVVSTRDLSGELDFENKKQFMGVKQYVIDREMNKEEILGICDKFPQSFIALSFSFGDTELKIKPKSPKSGKPSTKEDEKINPDFCKLKTKNEKIVKGILFDIDNFKKVEIIHDFIIDELEIPKDEKDFSKARENTIRKGKIVRKMTIDGEKSEKEAVLRA